MITINIKKYIKNIIYIILFIYLIKIKKEFFLTQNINLYWNLLNIIYFVNKLIKIPLILVIHIFLIIYLIYISKEKKYIILIITTIVPFMLITTKKYIKKYTYIKRPYTYINFKTNKIFKNYIPIWLKKKWKNKTDSSFPSGHTMFAYFWIKVLSKKKKNNKIIIYLFKIIILSRILFYLHRIEDVIFSIILNNIYIYIIKYICKLYFKNRKIISYFNIRK